MQIIHASFYLQITAEEFKFWTRKLYLHLLLFCQTETIEIPMCILMRFIPQLNKVQ